MNRDELRLLLTLQQNPTASAASLGKMIGITPPTAKAWLEKMRAANVYTGVHADLRVHRLGLEIDDFLIFPSSHEALTKVERFCDEHPYTLYRARVFGGNTQGLLTQFRYPDQARTHLEEAFRVMKDAGVIHGVRELPTLRSEYGSTYTKINLENWDMENMTWSFDWENWWKSAPSAGSPPQSSSRQNETKLEIDELDVRLLEEMTKDARQKNTVIIEKIGLTKNQMGVQQKISSRIARLDHEVVESYRVFINWNRFDIYNTVLVLAKAPAATTDTLVYHLSTTSFPFESGIRKTSDGFVWSARMPSAHLSELAALLWKMSETFEILIIDYKYSEFYGLWAQTFDRETHDWKSSRGFCLEAPLAAIGLS